MVIDINRVRGPQLAPPVVTTSVIGLATCLPDGSGFGFPAPATIVEVHVQQPLMPGGSTLVMSGETKPDGSFALTTTQLPRGGYDLEVRLINAFTGETEVKRSQRFVVRPTVVQSPGSIHIQFDAGMFLLPWNPQLPPLGRVNARELKYAPDFARALSLDLQQRQAGSTVWLLREFRIDAPGRDRDLDAMFKDLAAAGGTALVARIAAEIHDVVAAKAAKFPAPLRRPPDDVFLLALQHFAAMSVSQVRRTLPGFKLGRALADAFGVTMPPSFEDTTLALPAGCALLYVASHVARGHGVKVRLSGLTSMKYPRRQRHYNITEIVT